MRELLRKLPYAWRQRFRKSDIGYFLRADRWMP